MRSSYSFFYRAIERKAHLPEITINRRERQNGINNYYFIFALW